MMSIKNLSLGFCPALLAKSAQDVANHGIFRQIEDKAKKA
jgi:hypothetical protein